MKRITYFLVWLLAPFLYSCSSTDDKAASPNQTAANQNVNKGVYALETEASLDVLMNEIGDSKYVLLGEASHGTAEFYTWRAAISRRLIEEKGFSFIAVEGDWPDGYQLNQYIKGATNVGINAKEALKAFNRWPTWMWANQEIADLAEWLRTYNSSQPNKVGFYGMDVYSLWESMEQVVQYLEQTNPEAAKSARAAYQCFASYNKDEQAYAAATMHQSEVCADELANMLQTVQATLNASPPQSSEEAFNLEQNALAAVNAERYYHAMVRSNAGSWNVRDRHMNQTINRLMQLHGPNAKCIIWAHNTHVGDARATDMKAEGMINIGQLIREEHSQEGVYVVGFSSYEGSVIAGQRWDAPMQRMNVPAAMKGSWEAILHNTQPANKIVLTKELKDNPKYMQSIGHRAIGVVYDPTNERGNYVPTVLPERYDAVLFIDKTEALHPLNVPGGRLAYTPSFIDFLRNY
jgi:erythromycin esterase-like protein